MQSRDRWVNWDQLAVGEDFWDMMEEVDERRVGEIKEQRQMEDIRRVHERRLSKMKIDREKFMSEEPYSFMCKIPVS